MWELPINHMIEQITKPTPEQIALWKACDEYIAKTKEYDDADTVSAA
jgi:hypothetical protein